jgi:aerotaxis receptor
VEQQAAATQEITRNVTESSVAVQSVTEQIGVVSDDAAASQERAADIRGASSSVATSIADLRTGIIRIIRTTTTDAERRSSKRVAVVAPCVVLADGVEHTAQLIDLSETGARLFAPVHLPAGSQATLRLGGADSVARFTVHEIYRDGSIGVAFAGDDVSAVFLAAVQRLLEEAERRAA